MASAFRLGQHPGVLRAAALAGIDHQRAALQRHAGQRAGGDHDLLAGQDEGPQVDVPRLDAGRRPGRARWRAGWSAGRCSFPGSALSCSAKSSRSPGVACGPDQHAVAAGGADRLDHQLVEIGQHMKEDDEVSGGSNGWPRPTPGAPNIWRKKSRSSSRASRWLARWPKPS